MKDLTLGITFEFEQSYLPTKRHKNELKRKMVTVRDIIVHYVDEEDFPVGIRVTDFDILPHDWNDPSESKYDTLDYRYYNGSLYEEPRSESGSDKGELTFSDEQAFIDCIRRNRVTRAREDYLYDFCEEKKYQEGKSVVTGDDLDDRVEDLQAHADRFIICNGKVWKKCGQPYYKVQTFGLGNNHGDTGFFIEWTNEEKISRDYFLATQKELAIADFKKTAEGRGDTESISTDDSPMRNIEILIPEAYTLKRVLGSNKYPGYTWSDKLDCYVKDYGDILSASHEDVYLISFRHDYGDRCLARVYVNNKFAFTEKEAKWYAIGQVMEDTKNVSFDDIGKIYSSDDVFDRVSA